jgi:hypothetical protein
MSDLGIRVLASCHALSPTCPEWTTGKRGPGRPAGTGKKKRKVSKEYASASRWSDRSSIQLCQSPRSRASGYFSVSLSGFGSVDGGSLAGNNCLMVSSSAASRRSRSRSGVWLCNLGPVSTVMHTSTTSFDHSPLSNGAWIIALVKSRLRRCSRPPSEAQTVRKTSSGDIGRRFWDRHPPTPRGPSQSG